MQQATQITNCCAAGNLRPYGLLEFNSHQEKSVQMTLDTVFI